MTGPGRCGVVALVAGVALLCGFGARAQVKPAPSTLLPMEPLWTTPTVLSAAPAAPPVYDAGHIFVALRDGHVTAVNVADGDVVWEVVHPDPVVGELAVGGALLYVASRDKLQGLETATGQTRWSIPIEAPLSAPLVWNNGWLIAALDTQILLALRAETGETIWRRSMGGGIHVTPSLAGKRMYVSLDNGGVVALSHMTGAVVWEHRLDGAPNQILPLDDLFVGATDNHFYRLSRLDGSIKWSVRTGGDIVGLPAVDETRVYFSSLDNMLYALNRRSGVQQWREPLAARPTAGPSHAGDLLVLGGMSQYIRFFDPVTGVSFGRIPAPSELALPPLSFWTVANRPLLVTVTGDGQLRVLRRAVGPRFFRVAPVWRTGVLLDLAVTANLGEGADDLNDDATPATATAIAEDDEAGVVAARPPSVGGEYAIQVAAFSNGASATGLVDRLLEQGYPAYVIFTLRPAEESVLYHVRIGHYPDRPAAEAIGRQVEDEQALDWFVVTLP